MTFEVISWDEYFMAMAFLSSQRSKDPIKQTGACIVNTSNRIVGIGYNGFPRNVPDDELSWAEEADDIVDTKHPYVCHAAMNAILNKNQDAVVAARMYTTHFPCNECAKIIIQSGISRIIYSRPPPTGCLKAEATRKLFELAGVSLVQFNCPRESIELDMTCL